MRQREGEGSLDNDGWIEGFSLLWDGWRRVRKAGDGILQVAGVW